MIKKRTLISLVLLVVFCAFGMTACKNNSASNTSVASPTTEVSVEPTPAPTPTPTPTPIPTPSAAEVSMVPLVPEGSASSPESSDGGSSSSSSGSGSTEVLKIKMESDAVTQLQELLQNLGYLDKVTGYFGTDTESAVKKFQDNNGLDADGIVGSGTWAKLRSDSAVKA